MRGRDTSGDVSGQALVRRLAEEQLANTRQLQRTANGLVRLAGFVVIVGVVAGVGLMLQKHQNPLCGSDPTALCSDSKTYPYFGDGVGLIAASIISAVWMALASHWARTYATAQLIAATRILSSPYA
jgi:hypothetical protein